MLAKKCKKLVAMLLTLSLALGLLGTAALANGTESSGGNPGPVTEQGVTVDKTATPLDENDKTTVSLSVGATEEKENVAVMFLLDKSTSQGMRDEAAAMLDELKTKTNTNILYNVVIFSGTATATGWKDIQDDEGLEATKENFVNAETTSGTNMTAGIQKAQSELATLPAGYDITYLVTLSDGITYVWDEDGQTYCVAVAGLNAAGTGVEVAPQTGADTWSMMYEYGTSMAEVYGSFETFLTAVLDKLEATRTGGYLTAWNGGSPVVEKYIETYVYDDDATAEVAAKYACGIDFAVYNSAVEYAALAAQFDKSFAYAVPELDSSGADNTSNWENYPWGKELMDYCQSQSTNAGEGSISNTDAEKIFSEIQDAILYAIQSGSVTDIIGDDFDLSGLDTVKLTVGGIELTGTADAENENLLNFGTADAQGVYPYTVEYRPATDREKEQLVWTINVPVESAAGVKLSYGLTLVNKAEEPGDYTVPTNESAVLDYTSTEGGSGTVTFPVPKLTYTVEDEGGNPDPDPPAPDWEVSKSKTATNLDSSYESQVTLSLPAGDYEGNLDVVFVLDGSTSSDKVDLTETAAGLLNVLAGYDNLTVKVGVVIFGGYKPVLATTELTVLDDTTVEALQDDVLTTAYNDLKDEDGNKLRSGSNLQAGVEAARELLNGDTTVTAEDKYMIILSDGGARVWINEDGESVAQLHVANNWNTTEDFRSRYVGDGKLELRTFDQLMEEAAAGHPVGAYAITYEESKGLSTSLPEGVNYATDPYYYSNVEAGTYYAACSMIEASSECNIIWTAYHWTTVGSEEETFVTSFRNWMAEKQYVTLYDVSDMQTEEEYQAVYADVHDDLIQLVDAGSKVVDVIGYGDDYNFDFVNSIDKLTLTEGGVELEKVKIDDTTYGFGPITDEESEATTYRYVLHYYADGATDEQTGGNGQVEGECIVWDINVPVTKDATVQLTYSVKLTNPKTAAGTYGQYDADGSEGYDGLYTNNSAVLYPVDSLGNVGAAEEFGKPTVSYTVSGGGGGSSYSYYTVTVNYLDKETGEKIAESYKTPSRIEGSRYDVTEYDAIAIDGYTYDSTSGDALSGTLNSNKVINVYYVAEETDIGDGETPTTDLPDTTDPGDGEVDIGDGETPTTDLPDTTDPGEEVDIGDGQTPTGNLPQTGTTVNPLYVAGMLMLALSMASAGTAGIILLKRKEN